MYTSGTTVNAEPLKPIDYWKQTLGLQPHPEGGFFAESYRSGERHVTADEKFPAQRSFSTAIYFLVPAGEFSALHRIQSDEVWHFYYCMPLEIVVLDRGALEVKRLGLDLDRGQAPQHVVPRGAWFGASVAAASGYCLVGCTVAPGFDFRDFELARRADLELSHPQHRDLIERYTRG